MEQTAVKRQAVIRDGAVWQELRVDGHMVARVWGVAEVQREGSDYMVIIRGDDGVPVGFFHVDEIL